MGSLQPVVFVASLQSVPVGRMAALVLLFKNGGSAEEINDRTIIPQRPFAN